MEIFLVRHGEMVYETSKGIDLDLINAYASGEREGPLSEKGRLQAGLVAEALAERRVDSLYSSAFLRTRQTAEASADRLGLEVEVAPEFGELRVGGLDPQRHPGQKAVLGILGGMNKALPCLVGERRSKRLVGYLLILYYFNAWSRGRTTGGESFEAAVDRVSQAFRKMAAGHGEKSRVAVFTHGYFIHLLVNYVLDPGGAGLRMLRSPYIRNGSLTRLVATPDASWQVASFAGTDHLVTGEQRR